MPTALPFRGEKGVAFEPLEFIRESGKSSYIGAEQSSYIIYDKTPELETLTEGKEIRVAKQLLTSYPFLE